MEDDELLGQGTVTLRLGLRGRREKLRARLTVPAVRQKGKQFPLVVFTNGFATEAKAYTQFAELTAAGGCAVLRYDVPGANGATDTFLVDALRSLLDYVEADPILQPFVATQSVLLAGHSRGAKISVLAAAVDERVAGLCLLDPIDNTVWAPLSRDFPSACAALAGLQSLGSERVLPVAIVGAGSGGDCAPVTSNYSEFFSASPKPSWLLLMPTAGHAQFLDTGGLGVVQRVVCQDGGARDEAVLAASGAVCQMWAQLVCGPLQPSGGQTDPLAGVTARLEVQRYLTRLGSSGEGRKVRELSIAVGTAANVTADSLQRYGLEFQSYLKL